MTGVQTGALPIYRRTIVVQRIPGHEALSAEEAEKIQAGGIILIQGILSSADLIMKICAERVPVSHTGMVVELQGVLSVVHTVNNTLSGIDGMQMHVLSEFAARARPFSLIVVRPRWKSAEQREKALVYVVSRLDKAVSFDNSFNFSDDSELYCTELLARALDYAGFWNSRENGLFVKTIFAFSYFLDRERFEPLLSHHPGFPVP